MSELAQLVVRVARDGTDTISMAVLMRGGDECVKLAVDGVCITIVRVELEEAMAKIEVKGA